MSFQMVLDLRVQSVASDGEVIELSYCMARTGFGTVEFDPWDDGISVMVCEASEPGAMPIADAMQKMREDVQWLYDEGQRYDQEWEEEMRREEEIRMPQGWLYDLQDRLMGVRVRLAA